MEIFTSQVGWEYEVILQTPRPTASLTSLYKSPSKDPSENSILLKVVGGPVPKIGEEVWVEECNGPLKVWHVAWIFRNGYPILIKVYVV